MWNLKKRVEDLLGEFSPQEHLSKEPIYQIEEEFRKDSITYQRISIAVDSDDKIPAFLIYPCNIQYNSPGILALHQTTNDTGIGAAEVIGLAGNKNYHYGFELAKMGFTVIAPDYPFFGRYSILTQDIYEKYGYESVTMKALINHIASINILVSLTTVNSNSIGCIGHSLGGTNSLFTAFFDKRIKAAVISAGFTTFKAYAEQSVTDDLSKWAQPDKYMPNTKKRFKNDPELMPFDFPELISSLNPLPLFLSTPKKDEIFDYQGAIQCVNVAKDSYGINSLNLIHVFPDVKHDFPQETRFHSYKFLSKHLKQSD